MNKKKKKILQNLGLNNQANKSRKTGWKIGPWDNNSGQYGREHKVVANRQTRSGCHTPQGQSRARMMAEMPSLLILQSRRGSSFN